MIEWNNQNPPSILVQQNQYIQMLQGSHKKKIAFLTERRGPEGVNVYVCFFIKSCLEFSETQEKKEKKILFHQKKFKL